MAVDNDLNSISHFPLTSYFVRACKAAVLKKGLHTLYLKEFYLNVINMLQWSGNMGAKGQLKCPALCSPYCGLISEGSRIVNMVVRGQHMTIFSCHCIHYLPYTHKGRSISFYWPVVPYGLVTRPGPSEMFLRVSEFICL